MTNPWDKRPRQPIGDDNPHDLWMAVGKALSAWEQLEEGLAMIFGQLVDSRFGSAQIAYGKLSSPQGRSDLLLSAADWVLAGRDDNLLDEITRLSRAAGNFSSRRNEIAHGIVMGGFAHGRDLGTYLYPPEYNSRKLLSRADRLAFVRKHGPDKYEFDFPFRPMEYAYVATDVTYYGDQFRELAWQASDLAYRTRLRCGELFPSPDKSQEPAPPPQSSNQQTN